MITLQISQDQLQDPKTAQALQELLSHMSGNEVEVNAPTKKKAFKYTPKSDVHIDPEVFDLMGGVLAKQKALLFLTLLKQEGQISSADMSEKLRETYPDFHPRAIGGITGAITRWVKEGGKKPVFQSFKDCFGSTHYRWLGSF